MATTSAARVHRAFVELWLVVALAAGHPAHECRHDKMHQAHAHVHRPVVPQDYGAREATPALEKRATELPPTSSLQPLRIHVYSGFLGADKGHTCYSTTDTFSIGGASPRGPECSERTSDYCFGRCSEEYVLTAEKKRFLEEDLVPDLVAMVRNMLSVLPVRGGLVLNGGSCGFYGGLRVPDPLTLPPGVPDADFVLFLTARPILGDTIAYAGHCQTDQNGRPIAAHFNWSPSHFESSMTESLRAYYLRVALHELTHALAFSPSLLVDFPRSVSGRISSLETIPSWYGFQRAVVTPRVAAAARAHFGCDAVAGAHLEDGGGSGSAGSHWESRLFRDEYMTAAASPGPRVVSALTLALFEDSGWYAANASAAEPLQWGFRAGCGFVHESCAEWPRILDKSVDGLDLPPYACGLSSPDRCYYDQRAKAYCELKTYDFLPARFQYFASNPELGGYSQMLDYCPVYRAYSNGNCADPSNAGDEPRRHMPFIDTDGPRGEDGGATSFFGPADPDPDQFCPSCRCFEATPADSAAAFEGEDGGLQPGCFRMRCETERELNVHVGAGRWVKCPEDGGIVHIESPRARTRPTRLRCPPAARVCALEPGFWPTIRSVTPRRGPIEGGTEVTLRGTNLVGAGETPEVLVGDVPASAVHAVSAEELVFITGPNPRATSRDTSDVTVSDALGRAAVLHAGFTYLPGWRPYAETAAICAAVAALCMWAAPWLVVPQLRAHAAHVHARAQQQLRARNAARGLEQGRGSEAAVAGGTSAAQRASAAAPAALAGAAGGSASNGASSR